MVMNGHQVHQVLVLQITASQGHASGWIHDLNLTFRACLPVFGKSPHFISGQGNVVIDGLYLSLEKSQSFQAVKNQLERGDINGFLSGHLPVILDLISSSRYHQPPKNQKSQKSQNRPFRKKQKRVKTFWICQSSQSHEYPLLGYEHPS